MADLIEREAVLSVMEKASIGGMITDSIRAIPAITDSDYEQGFKDGLKSECLEELKPLMAKLIEGCTEAIKGIAPMLIDNARLTIRHGVNRWIPCSERLPEQGERVIVAIFGSDMIMPNEGETLQDAIERSRKEGYITVGFIGSDGWYGADLFPLMVHPSYWMPKPDLPEPPKEGASDD